MPNKYLVILISCLCVIDIYGQNNRYFQKISINEGLSFEAVETIGQDTLGFVWIGTKNGLNRYDGENFKIYTDRNSNLEGNGISKIKFTEDDRMWVGTYNGLFLYYPLQDTFELIKLTGSVDNSALIQVNDIIEGSKGNLWVAAENGLYEVQNSDGVFGIEKKDLRSLGGVSIKSIVSFDGKNLYLGTKDKGLWSYHINDRQDYQPDILKDNPTYSELNIREVFHLGKETLVGTWGDGLFRLDEENNLFQRIPLSSWDLDINTVNSIDTINGSIWVGLSNGLLELDAKNYEIIAVHQKNEFQYSLPGAGIACSYKDRDLNIWFGSTNDGVGVLKADNDGITMHFGDLIDGQLSGFSSLVYLDDYLYLGSKKGIVVFDLEKDIKLPLSQFHSFSGLPNYFTNSAASNNLDRLLFGSFMNGFLLINTSDSTTGIFEHNANTNSLAHNHVRDAIFDDSGIFIATWGGGLNYYDVATRQFINYQYRDGDPTSLSDDDVIALESENDSLIWLATYGGGVNRFNLKTGRFERFSSSPDDTTTLSSNDVISLYKDSDQKLWVGYWGGGLDFIDLKSLKITRFSDTHNLPSYIVTSIEGDVDGNIWFSTKNGVCKYDKDLDQVLIFTNGFDIETNAYGIGVSTVDDNGNIYFGSEYGFLKINPNLPNASGAGTEIVFTGISILDEPVTPHDEYLEKQLLYLKKDDMLTLEYYHSLITIEFANPQFPTSANCDYEVMLVGFDREWRNLGRSSRVTYTNLNPGDYKFRVKSSCGSTQNTSYSKDLNIYIKKPWWITWWAFTGYVLLFVFLLYLFFRYSARWANIKSKLRTEQLLRHKEQELNDLKQRFFTNLSHEIRTPLTLIINSVERLSSKIPVNKEYQKSFLSIRKNVNHLTQLVNEVMDFRKIEAEKQRLKIVRANFIEFAKEVFLSFTDLADRKYINYSFLTTTDQIEMFFDRDQLEKVLYNLISNAIKYTPENGSVDLSIDRDEQYCYFVVKDSGKGISAEDQSKIFEPFNRGSGTSQNQETGFGLGLYITKGIVKEHSGEILLESSSEEGTRFFIKIPLGSAHFSPTQIILEDKTEETVESYLAEDGGEDSDIWPFDLTDQTILIVEDNDDLRSYLVSLFEESFEVFDAANGQIALDIATEKIPDLIISDVMMPGLDGITLTQKLKTDKRTSHIPVIILTARSSLIYKQEGYETGADDYITKPFSKMMLMTRVRNLLRNRKLVSERIQKDIITGPKDLSLNSRDEEFLKELIEVIEENIVEEELNATFISKSLGMSHSVIYKKVKSLTSMSLVEFIRDFRLKKAAKYISELGYSVTETSFKVGFSDTKYFSKMFKKKFGVNPSKYSV